MKNRFTVIVVGILVILLKIARVDVVFDSASTCSPLHKKKAIFLVFFLLLLFWVCETLFLYKRVILNAPFLVICIWNDP